MFRRIAISSVALVLLTPPAAAIAKVNAPAACVENVPPLSANYIKKLYDPNNGHIYGAVQLRRDTCFRYWAVVQLRRPMGLGSDSRATAYLTWKPRNGTIRTISCASPGGTGYIQGRLKTTCRTPKVSGNFVDFFVGSGHYQFEVPYDGWKKIGAGQTARIPGPR